MTKTPDAPLVSVIIPTRDRPEDLARCLPTVLASDLTDFEVVIIDQSGTDATRQLVESLGDPRIRYHRHDASGKSRALNYGIALARGQVLAFTDDDCTVPPDWLRRGLATLEREPEAGIVFGAAKAAPHDPGDTFVPTFLPRAYRRLQGRLARAQCFALAAPNMMIRPDVFQRVSAFDEWLGAGSLFPSGDDDDFAYRAVRAGFTVVIDPDNAIVHWALRSYSDGSGRKLLRNHFYGAGAFLMKHLRCGDPLAAYMLARLVLKEMRYLLSNLVRHRRASGAGRLAFLGLGLVRGLLHPLDRRRRLYAAPRNGRV